MKRSSIGQKKLKKFIKEQSSCGVTVTKIARKIGVSQAGLYCLVVGKYKPSIQTAAFIEDVSGISMRDWITFRQA